MFDLDSFVFRSNGFTNIINAFFFYTQLKTNKNLLASNYRVESSLSIAFYHLNYQILRKHCYSDSLKGGTT